MTIDLEKKMKHCEKKYEKSLAKLTNEISKLKKINNDLLKGKD